MAEKTKQYIQQSGQTAPTEAEGRTVGAGQEYGNLDTEGDWTRKHNENSGQAKGPPKPQEVGEHKPGDKPGAIHVNDEHASPGGDEKA